MSAVPAPRAPPDDRLGEILRQVRRIELRTERMVSSLTAGAFRSAFKGSGLEFEEEIGRAHV